MFQLMSDSEIAVNLIILCVGLIPCIGLVSYVFYKAYKKNE